MGEREIVLLQSRGHDDVCAGNEGALTDEGALANLSFSNYVNRVMVDLDHSPVDKYLRRRPIVKYQLSFYHSTHFYF